MPIRIYTKTGDQGETGLFGGGRVPKDHPRTTAYGEIDELNSTLGVVRATPPVDFHDALLESIQRDLFSIGGHLATPDPVKVAKALEKADLSEERVALFERVMDDADAELPPLRSFVLPAGTQKAAALHLARTVCRRAERSVVSLSRESDVPPLFLVYLNRLSDLLFTLARLANHRSAWGTSPGEQVTGDRHPCARPIPGLRGTGRPGSPRAVERDHLGTGHVTMIADASVYELLQTGRLSRAKWNGDAITFPAGEDSKNRKEWAQSPTSSSTVPLGATAGSSPSAAASPATSRASWPPPFFAGSRSSKHRHRCSPWWTRRSEVRPAWTRDTGRTWSARFYPPVAVVRRSPSASNPARSRLSGWLGGSREAWTHRGPRVLRVDGA